MALRAVSNYLRLPRKTFQILDTLAYHAKSMYNVGVRQEAVSWIAPCYPFRSGYPYPGMHFRQRNCVEPGGQRGEHRKSEPVNLPGKRCHGEANAEPIVWVVIRDKRNQTDTLEPKW